jgi:hypothetical protein
VKRACRTLFFMILMLASLLVSSVPLLVAIADIAIPCTVLSTFTCCESCLSFRIDWSTYSFRSSLVDIPLISVIRSVAAICKGLSSCILPPLPHSCLDVSGFAARACMHACSVFSSSVLASCALEELLLCLLISLVLVLVLSHAQVLTSYARYRASAMALT